MCTICAGKRIENAQQLQGRIYSAHCFCFVRAVFVYEKSAWDIDPPSPAINTRVFVGN